MDNRLRLPNFFIIGAAKCGTTELASLLQTHDSIFVPDHKEPCYFARDEMHLHAELFLSDMPYWNGPFDWDAGFDSHLREYSRYFANAPAHALCCDATTEYLPSRRAAGRIRKLIPDAKLIVMLREPTKRMISDYWFHIQYDSRVISTPETYFTLNHSVWRLRWGLYQEHLTHWLSVFPREQFHFIIFEEYIAPETRQGVLDEVCQFLEIEPTLDATRKVFSNKTAYPRSLKLELFLNMIRQRFGLPGTSKPWEYKRPYGRRRILLNKIVQAISSFNMDENRRPQPWPAQLVERIQIYYRHENARLSELIGRDVEAIWYGRKENKAAAPVRALTPGETGAVLADRSLVAR
jgi:hypothetical protein